MVKKSRTCLIRLEDITQHSIINRFTSIRDGALEVFLILYSAADEDNYSELSLTDIVNLCGYSRWKVQACLDALEDAHYIRRELKGIAGHTQVFSILKTTYSPM